MDFIPGLTLSELFFEEVVEPIVTSNFGGLEYSAGLLGYGSEVLGFDTIQSTDHDWGPRVILFLRPEDYENEHQNISKKLMTTLPATFRGYCVNFERSPSGSLVMSEPTGNLINHRVDIYTIHGFFEKHIGFSPDMTPRPAEWMLFSDQALMELTSGKIFRDDLGLEDVRSRFSYYPGDVWRYLLASQWKRISEDEHLMPRAGDAGDDVGSTIIATRLVRDIMRLCFLMEKEYAPYAKWFGSAFSRLSCGLKLLPLLRKVVRATNWEEQMNSLGDAYEAVAKIHNSMGITENIEPTTRDFHDRPYRVLEAERFSEKIYETIEAEDVLSLPKNLGSVDQISDSTDLLSYPVIKRRLRPLYES